MHIQFQDVSKPNQRKSEIWSQF